MVFCSFTFLANILGRIILDGPIQHRHILWTRRNRLSFRDGDGGLLLRTLVSVLPLAELVGSERGKEKKVAIRYALYMSALQYPGDMLNLGTGLLIRPHGASFHEITLRPHFTENRYTKELISSVANV